MCRFFHRKSRTFSSHPGKGVDEKSKIPNPFWPTCLIAIIAFVCYVNSLACGLVFDDQPAIIDNMDLRPQTPLSNLFFNDFWGTPMQREDSHKSYRPLCVLTFRINYWIHGLRPAGYHLANILLHVTVCLLYYRFCSEFLTSSGSLAATLLFAVHPIHTEAVTGVVGRAELLSSIFFLLALLSYIRSRRNAERNDFKSVLHCLAMASVAMLSKEQGITVVAVCMTYDILLVQQVGCTSTVPERAPRSKIKGPTPTWRKDLVLRLLLMTVGTMFLLVMRMKIMGSKLPIFNKFDNPASSEGWPVRHLTHNYLVALNFWLLLFPVDLCCDWTMGTVPLVKSFIDPRVVAPLLFYAVICRLVWVGRQSHIRISEKVIMGVSLCAFPFIPASNLLYPVGFVIAERVLYLPSMGFCFLIACGWHELRQRYKKSKMILHVCLVILLCLNAAKTLLRNHDWKDEETLFTSGLQFTSSNAKLYNNLGHVMESRERHEEALQLFLKAAQTQPDDLGSHLNVGRMYNILGLTERAEKAFRLAKDLLPKKRPGETYKTHIVPRHLDLFLNLGSLLSRNDSRLEEAQELYKEAISMKADYIDAYMQRANVLLKLNRSDEAHDMYEEALKHDRMNPDIFYNMGVLLLEQGKSIQALARFDQALQINPEHEKSLLNYAILIQDSGDSSLRRIAHERLQVLLDKGQQPERTYFNMGMLAMQDSDTSKAEDYFRKALQFKPDFDAALFNLALIFYEKGRLLEALPYLEKLDKRHVKGLVLLGNIYFRELNNYTAARQCYELILKHNPKHIAALHNLCAAHFQLGELENAEACLMRASNLAPEERYIQHHLSIVREHRRKILILDTEEKMSQCSATNKNCDRFYEGSRAKHPIFRRKNSSINVNNI